MGAGWVTEEGGRDAQSASPNVDGEVNWVTAGLNYWGREQKEPGEWDATMFRSGWGSSEGYDAWVSPSSTSVPYTHLSAD